jgi:hypothetical protein
MYPKSHQMIDEQRWKKQATPRKDVHLSDLVQRLEGEGRLLVNKLFQVVGWVVNRQLHGGLMLATASQANSTSNLCPINKLGAASSSPGVPDSVKEAFLKQGIALTVLSYHTPMYAHLSSIRSNVYLVQDYIK